MRKKYQDCYKKKPQKCDLSGMSLEGSKGYCWEMFGEVGGTCLGGCLKDLDRCLDSLG